MFWSSRLTYHPDLLLGAIALDEIQLSPRDFQCRRWVQAVKVSRGTPLNDVAVRMLGAEAA
jgi:hypothetical protein